MNFSEIYVEDNYAYYTTFSDWTSITNKNTAFKFSPFNLPTNHRIEFKLKSTGGIRIACGDTTNIDSGGYLNWIYAWYVDNKKIYYRNSQNNALEQSLSYTISSSTVFAIEYNGTTLKLYAGDTLLTTLTCQDPLTLTRLVRLNNDTINNMDHIKVKSL